MKNCHQPRTIKGKLVVIFQHGLCQTEPLHCQAFPEPWSAPSLSKQPSHEWTIISHSSGEGYGLAANYVNRWSTDMSASRLDALDSLLSCTAPLRGHPLRAPTDEENPEVVHHLCLDLVWDKRQVLTIPHSLQADLTYWKTPRVLTMGLPQRHTSGSLARSHRPGSLWLVWASQVVGERWKNPLSLLTGACPWCLVCSVPLYPFPSVQWIWVHSDSFSLCKCARQQMMCCQICHFCQNGTPLIPWGPLGYIINVPSFCHCITV